MGHVLIYPKTVERQTEERDKGVGTSLEAVANKEQNHTVEEKKNT